MCVNVIIMCLCTSHIQIADFGMARDVTDDIYYVASGGKIPVKWTAPEVADQYNYTYAASMCSYRTSFFFNKLFAQKFSSPSQHQSLYPCTPCK